MSINVDEIIESGNSLIVKASGDPGTIEELSTLRSDLATQYGKSEENVLIFNEESFNVIINGS